MTQPLTPPDCDLRSFDWFPFHHKRMRQSAFWKRASDAACRISVEFWSEAYEQVPAGSLPDDDVQLSEWAGFGRRNLAEWLAIKDEVMAAWVLCEDGRWYHPTLCEVALAAWGERQGYLQKREDDRRRKEEYRKRAQKTDDVHDSSQSQDLGQSGLSHGTSSDVPLEIALKGTETETVVVGGVGAREAAADDWPEADHVRLIVEATASSWLDPQKSPGLITTSGLIFSWKAAGASWRRDVLPVVAGICAGQREPIGSWRFFTAAVMRAIADNRATLEIPTATGPPRDLNRAVQQFQPRYSHERRSSDQRQTAFVERLQDIDAAMAAAVE